MMPINPFPALKLARPLLFVGLAAGAAAVAVWAKRQLKSPGQTLIRVEPTDQQLETLVEVPWGVEVPR